MDATRRDVDFHQQPAHVEGQEEGGRDARPRAPHAIGFQQAPLGFDDALQSFHHPLPSCANLEGHELTPFEYAAGERNRTRRARGGDHPRGGRRHAHGATQGAARLER